MKHITVGGVRYAFEDSYQPTEEDMTDLATLSEYLIERVGQPGTITDEMAQKQAEARQRIEERNARIRGEQ